MDGGATHPTISIILEDAAPGQGDVRPHAEVLPPAYRSALIRWLEVTEADGDAPVRTRGARRPAYDAAPMPQDGAR